MSLYIGRRALVGGAGITPTRTAGVFCATHQNPHFVAIKTPSLIGWYLLKIELEHGLSYAPIAKLYVDYGEGFDEEDAITLKVSSGISAKRLCFFSRKPKAIRLDPLDSPGLFVLRSFSLCWVPAVLAQGSLYRWLTQYGEFRGKSIAEIKRVLGRKARAIGFDIHELAWNIYGGAFQSISSSQGYATWLLMNSPDRKELLQRYKELTKVAKALPEISVVVPVYNTPAAYLEECIRSVMEQVYPHWQLCLVDDASTNSETTAVLKSYEKADERIQVVYRPANGHIVEASNSGLEVATGAYIGLLDHDDMLAPHALLSVAQELVKNPELLLVYSDEDKLAHNGGRCEPHFKPDWNPDLLLGQNYICHLTVISAALIRRVGGFRPGSEGSQDHDLLLRCMPYLSADTVFHIPDVLYHWRMMAGSTAASASGKNYTSSAGLNAVSYYLKSIASGAQVEEGVVPNTYKVLWPLPEQQPTVSLLVPTRNGVHILKPCIEAILEKTDYSNYEVIILDNQSDCPETLAYFDSVCQDERVSVKSWDYPFNFSAINNFGVAQSKGKIIGLLNNDIEPINPEWLSDMVRQVCRPEIGCVGAKLYYPNETIQHAGVILGIGGVAGHSHKYYPRNSYGYHSRLCLVQNLSAVTAACLLVRRSVYDEVGGLEENGLAVAFNDVDFCLKVREAGYRNLWTPYAEAYHHESVSRGAEDTPEKKKRFSSEVIFMQEKWGDILSKDPAYNPNLSDSHEDFSIKTRVIY